MFQILIDAVKVVLSKEVRESASTLVTFLNKSPDWQKDICTIEARISYDERERVDLIRRLVIDKLSRLSFSTNQAKAFGYAYGEIVQNAFEHAVKKKNKPPIRIEVDICPEYATLTVYNPTNVAINLKSWIQNGYEQLSSSNKAGRGRGLIMSYRKCDVLTDTPNNGLKAVIYKDEVVIDHFDNDGVTVVVPLSGIKNPSFGRRMLEYIRRLDAKKIALCLKRLGRDFDPTRKSLRLRPDFGEGADGDECSSEVIHELIASIVDLGKEGKMAVRIVHNDTDLLDLVPKDTIYETVEQAVESLRKVDVRPSK